MNERRTRRHDSHWLILAIGFALALDPTRAAFAAEGAVLATAGQLEREARALEVLKAPAVQRATAELERTYLADARGKTPSGAATARRAAESTAAAAAYAVVNDDPDRPVVFWGVNAPHQWFGMALPRAGYGIENPDNAYRHFHVDGASRYEIRGRFNSPGPAELHFVVMDMPPSDKSIQVEGGEMLATLRSDAMAIAADGSFTITLDHDPANGRSNHMQLPRDGHFPVHVRDLFTDWSTQNPVTLEIHRIAGPPAAPEPGLALLVKRAAARLAQMGPFWLAYNNQHLYSRPANTIPVPRVRPGGRGLSASGHFDLASDEALIVTLDRLGAGSLGFQLADPWGVAYEYVERTSSLNQTQAAANPDGSFTFVISASDPGVHNWLDPDGQTAGILVLRWQILPASVAVEKGIREVRVVKLAALAKTPPTGTRFVTAEERAKQRAERARKYSRRLGP